MFLPLKEACFFSVRSFGVCGTENSDPHLRAGGRDTILITEKEDDCKDLIMLFGQEFISVISLAA